MAESVTLGGVNYTIPDPGDQPNWATGLTPYLVAIAANVASAPAFMQPVSVTATPQTGVSGKTYLVTTSSIAITINLPAPATNMWLMVKDVSGAAATRNITLHRPGSQTIDGTASDKVLSRNFGTWIICSDGTNYFVLNEFPDSGLVNADVASAAAIAVSKLAALTASRAVASDGSGFLTASATTATELGYVSGVTSAIQTQLNAKLATAGGTVAGNLVVTNATSSSPLEILDSTNTQAGWIGMGGGAALNDFIIAANRSINGTYLQTGQAAAAIQLESKPADGNITFYTNAANNAAMVLAATIDKNGVATFSRQLIGKGTTTNDNAAAGYIGEYIESVFAAVAAGAAGAFSDSGNIALTAGDWDVTLNCMAVYSVFGANTSWAMGISTTSGNSTTGLTSGSNYYSSLPPVLNNCNGANALGVYRMSLSGSTTVYAKTQIAFSGGTWTWYGRLSARRVR